MFEDNPLRVLIRDELFLGIPGEQIYMDEEFWARFLKLAIEKARDHEFDI